MAETRGWPRLSRELVDLGIVAEGETVPVGGRGRPSEGVCLAGDVDGSGDRELIVGSHFLGSHFLGWDRVPLSDLVQRATGLPAVAANDVQSLTAAHHWFGAGVGLRSFAVIGLGMGIGAGIGAGIVVNGEVIRGSRGHPGKIGHLPVTGTGPRCDRGHAGCVSAYVTAPAIARNCGAEGFDDAVARARAGESAAVAARRRR